ncbi:ATP-binding cassette domain-containing protein [Candidatus Saganbacteria bacterium]|uniref:ATP-binding cassette domain-containing protein n=1 Tax=Candidatus Saganbacteria bacterium TaxID=2575572 RepID=A0A9D6ULP7_UNCSA|nr:ATP-binding cassette domain-containing protein [Candidatus Saganbacteria bacterium]
MIVEARNLTKKFKDLPAVNGVSFAISRGECFGFLGPNGAGKTTTIKMIHCVSPKTAGELLVFGQPASIINREIKKRVGVIPQENNLDADLTVYENLLLFARFFDLGSRQTDGRIRELLTFVGLEGKRNSKIDELSVGMKRRLLVARALINQPELIIADEPTTGLDPQARHLIWQRLRELKAKGVTMVLTTQYMEEAAQLCDRLVVMYQGKILKEGVPDKLVEEEIGREVVEVRIGEERDGEILKTLEGEKFEYERVGDTLYFYCRDGRSLLHKIMALDLPKVLHRPASLEDVFLKLTGRSLNE